MIMLSQKNCPKCRVLEEYLKMCLKDRYVNDIEVVMREDNEKSFMNYARKYGIMATPALIAGDNVLHSPSNEDALDFLEKHIQ